MLTTATGITELLKQSRQGDRAAEAELVNAVYPELRKLARRYMAAERIGHTLPPTALVHEAYLRIFSGAPVAWADRAHFRAVIARQMRQALMDHGRGRSAGKRAGLRVELDEAHAVSGVREHDLQEVDELLRRLKEVDPDAANVTELKFFGGMSDQEVAQELGVSHSTVRRHWKFASAWLGSRIRPVKKLTNSEEGIR